MDFKHWKGISMSHCYQLGRHIRRNSLNAAWVMLTNCGVFIAPVGGVTEGAGTTSVSLRATAATAAGGEAERAKWIALSRESISDTLHKVCPQPSPCLTEPKQTRELALRKKKKSASHHSGRLLFLSPVPILSPTMLSLALLFCQPLQPCVYPCVSLEQAVKCSLQKTPQKPIYS